MGHDKRDRHAELVRRASRVLSIEAEAIQGLRGRLPQKFFPGRATSFAAPRGEVDFRGY